jgi:hypothetical protein
MAVREEQQMITCIPDISTLLRTGHFYFALTMMSEIVDTLSALW